MTYTYVVLEISDAAYREIKQKLTDAGYEHAFHDDVIDMHGIAVQSDVPATPKKKEHKWEFYANGTFCTRCGAQIGSGYDCK